METGKTGAGGTGLIDSRVPFWTCYALDDYETSQWRGTVDS